MHSSNIHSSQSHCLPSGQCVHGRKCNIESIERNIDRSDVEAFLGTLSVGVRQLPTCPTTGRIPSRDVECTTDIREGGQGSECSVACGDEAIRAVRAGDGIEGTAGAVIGLIVGKSFGGGKDDGWEGGESKCGEEGGELHRLENRYECQLKKSVDQLVLCFVGRMKMDVLYTDAPRASEEHRSDVWGKPREDYAAPKITFSQVRSPRDSNAVLAVHENRQWREMAGSMRSRIPSYVGGEQSLWAATKRDPK